MHIFKRDACSFDVPHSDDCRHIDKLKVIRTLIEDFCRDQSCIKYASQPSSFATKAHVLPSITRLEAAFMLTVSILKEAVFICSWQPHESGRNLVVPDIVHVISSQQDSVSLLGFNKSDIR